MRVLWLCNIMLPAFAKKEGLPYSNREGWLTGSFERLIHERASGSNRGWLVDLAVAFPVPASLGDCKVQHVDETTGTTVTYYGFQENLNTPEIYDKSLETRFAEIIDDCDPDIVHIFGTEFPHTLAMVRAFGEPERTLIGIQGLCCAIAEAYMSDLPYPVQRRVTFRDWYRKDSLREQQDKMRLRGRQEIQSIRGTGHVTGRTCFDREETAEINVEAQYHPMNETLRSNFYSGHWDIRNVEPHSIFLSQGDYPLKGFHYMLEAMPEILRSFPDTRLYVSGNSIIGNVGGLIRERKRYPEPLWITSYGKYLKSLIRDNGLQGHVFMLGRLDAEAMKAQYLRSHVFVCPSRLENSPNSLCEAMLLGTPVVAAKVGGIGDLVADGEEGILFPGGNSEELAEGVKTLFYDVGAAQTLSANARRTAQRRHDPDTNFRRLIEIYRAILG